MPKLPRLMAGEEPETLGQILSVVGDQSSPAPQE